MAPPVRAAPDEMFTMRPPPAPAAKVPLRAGRRERAVEVHGPRSAARLRRRLSVQAIESPADPGIVDEGIEAPNRSSIAANIRATLRSH
jgi:hypothetical protein